MMLPMLLMIPRNTYYKLGLIPRLSAKLQLMRLINIQSIILLQSSLEDAGTPAFFLELFFVP